MPNIPNRGTPKVLRQNPAERQTQLNGILLARSIIMTMAGEDEKPSPLVRYIQSLGPSPTAGMELGQDGLLIAADILDVLAEAASGKIDPFVIGTKLVTIIISALPELKEDVEVIKAIEALKGRARE